MFVDFFYALRKEGIPVTISEFLDFLKVLQEYHRQNVMMDFEKLFLIGRSLFVKDTKDYAAYHKVFSSYFLQVESLPLDRLEEIIQKWMENFVDSNTDQVSLEKKYGVKELFEELKKRIQEQKEEHHGGSYWIGTGGSSPFGQCGVNGQGIRIGEKSHIRTALEKYSPAQYEEYRADEVFHVRQYKVALKKLRKYRKSGETILNIGETVKKTSENLGEPLPVFEKEKKNQIALVVLMDAGGSMLPFQSPVSKFFSACFQLRFFKEIHYFYFHNTLYDWVFFDAKFRKKLHIEEFYRKFSGDYRVIFVGDACMNPYELYDKYHAFLEYYYLEDRLLSKEELQKKQENIKSSYQRLREFRKKYPYSIWLNPLRKFRWEHETVSAIRQIFPMFFLNATGLEEAIPYLLRR